MSPSPIADTDTLRLRLGTLLAQPPHPPTPAAWQDLLSLAQDLAAAYDRYLEIFRTSRDGFLLFTPEGRVLDANPAFCDLLGYSLEELRASPGTTAFTPERWHEWEAREIYQRRLLVSGQSGLYEKEFRRKDGAVLPVEVQAYAVRDAHDHPAHLWATVRDLTPVRHRQQRIALLGRMLDEAPASITIHTPEGHFLYANRHTLRLHGYGTESELLELTLHDLVTPETAPQLAEHLRQTAREGKARFETTHRRRDGSTFPLEVLSKSIHCFGQPAVLSIATDITDRRRAEESLRESEERYRLLSEVTPQGIVLHRQTTAMDLNASLARMIGCPREQLLHRDILDFVHPEDQPLVRERLAHDYSPPYAIRIARHNGEYFIAEIEARNFLRKGEVWRVTAVRDISERVRVEAKVAEQLHELQRWYQATLGREARVSELKREVNELLAQAGQPIRYPSVSAAP